jgi:hypothetical protein
MEAADDTNRELASIKLILISGSAKEGAARDTETTLDACESFEFFASTL